MPKYSSQVHVTIRNREFVAIKLTLFQGLAVLEEEKHMEDKIQP